jgi:hypothetical protein
MDLLAIARKIWRHRLATVPVIVLTLCGAVYVVAVKEPLYEATSTYLLVNPPAVPTADEVARTPGLSQMRADNPYTRFTDQSVVVDVLARSMSTDSARRELVRAGADPGYTVEPAAQFGSSKPIVQATGTGPTPRTAIRTARLVGRAVLGELERMQQVQQIDSRYQITALQVEAPDTAKLQPSGHIRMLIGLLALGVVLLFIVVSLIDGLQAVKRNRAQHAALGSLGTPWDETFDETWLARPLHADAESEPALVNGRHDGPLSDRGEQHRYTR